MNTNKFAELISMLQSDDPPLTYEHGYHSLTGRINTGKVNEVIDKLIELEQKE